MEQLALLELVGLALGATLVLALPISLLRGLGFVFAKATSKATLSDPGFQKYLAAISPPKKAEPVLEVIVELDDDEEIEELEDLEDLEDLEERLCEVDDEEYCGLRVLSDYEFVGQEEEIHPSFWNLS